MESKKIGKQTNLENTLTIDVEDWFHILDIPSVPSLEVWHQLESRVVSNTLLILDMLSHHQTHGTFFILGWVAEHFPDLVREIEKRGHEIGTHGYGHELVYNLTPARFREDVGYSLEVISRFTSRPILGYRAPGFSLNSASQWALDILVELGIRYDASIFPMTRNHGGFSEFSSKERWINTPKGNRILEIGVTPINFLGKKIYLFGGGYFRLTPLCLIEMGIRQLNTEGKSALVYLHPREFDPTHPRLQMNVYRSFTTYINLHKTPKKFREILKKFNFNSIGNKFFQQQI